MPLGQRGDGEEYKQSQPTVLQYLAETPTQEVSYTRIEGGYAISGIMATECERIVLPDTYDDEPILEPDGAVYIGKWLYKYNDTPTVTEFVIPDWVKGISYNAFENCTNLVSVTVPEGITELRSSTFQGCTSLKTVILPSTLTIIHSSVFKNCESLTDITLPERVSAIGGGVFENCKQLKSIVIPNAVIDGGKLVSFFMQSAFMGCENLESVVLSENLKILAAALFFKCTNLKQITLPNSLETIGVQVFAHTEIESIILPKSVQMMDSNAFARSNLNAIYYEGTLRIGIKFILLKNKNFILGKFPFIITVQQSPRKKAIFGIM